MRRLRYGSGKSSADTIRKKMAGSSTGVKAASPTKVKSSSTTKKSGGGGRRRFGFFDAIKTMGTQSMRQSDKPAMGYKPEEDYGSLMDRFRAETAQRERADADELAGIFGKAHQRRAKRASERQKKLSEKTGPTPRTRKDLGGIRTYMGQGRYGGGSGTRSATMGMNKRQRDVYSRLRAYGKK